MNLIDDLSTLTTIYKQSLIKLSNLAICCICHSMEEKVLNGENYLVADLAIGLLSIGVEDNNIKFKFTPSKKLEDSIRKTIISKKSPLTTKVDTSLKDSIVKAYKDLL